ncbi:MAG: glycosyltransferase [Bacteroidota bacterium]
MRVCDLTHAYTDTSGGIRTTIDAKRRYLLRHTDHEHVLIAPGPKDGVERDGRATTIRVAGPVIPGADPYRFFLRADKVRAALAAVQPDLVELHTFYTSPWAAFSYRKMHPVAVTAFYHTDLPSAYVRPAAARLLGERAGDVAERWTEAYVRTVFDRCDRGFAVSADLVQRLRRMGVAAPLDAVPLGVDLGLFHPAKRDPALREQLGVAGDGLLLVYAGRLDSEKQPAVLADAVELLPAGLRPTLVLAGQGPHRAALEARAATGERLRVLPYVGDKEALARLLASADVYVTAGPHETFGLSVVEAQASGLPVVGVAAGALVDRVPPRAGRLGPVGDASAFARNIAEVAAERERFGAAARAHVEAAFSWDRTFERLLAVYDAVLGRQQA